ncbi:MAG: WHG domain-containing protein [Oscillospiraceae bacterium]|nr:WHG domain-containing protein [Oscillospiraceae bacterium]
MPPKAKINRQRIIDAALQVIRTRGHEQLNARAIAQVLECSTQPVLYYFQTIDAIRQAAYQAADELHTAAIQPKGERGIHPLLELGLNYIRFAHEEKNLFRFLFQSNGFGGRSMAGLLSSPGGEELIGMFAAGMKCSPQQAREAFLGLFVSAHGIASLLANNAMEYEEDAFAAILKRTCGSVKGADQ